MQNTHTTIALVLDRSGSMSSCIEAAIAAANDFIRGHRQAEGTADLTITLFDDIIQIDDQPRPIDQVPEFDTNNFVPRATTALLDAIGTTIDHLGQRLAALPEAERPGTVIVAILTDGLENASQCFTWQAIHDMIKHQEEVYSWEFFFLAAGEEAIRQANEIGINPNHSSAFANDHAGYSAASSSLLLKTSSIRASKHRHLTVEEQQAYETPLHESLEEQYQNIKNKGKNT